MGRWEKPPTRRRISQPRRPSVGTFDANDNLTSSKLPTGATTTMAYANANATYKYSPTRITNPQGNAWNLAYDPKGNLTSVSDSMPTPGTSRLAYNANGTVSSATDAKGAVTTFGYDARGNQTSATPPADDWRSEATPPGPPPTSTTPRTASPRSACPEDGSMPTPTTR
ncbi:MAG: hypothetical protein M3535_09350 [Actinomycetota bacterium]|nr:hypothetical protein [Actinomycetota bacterium]